MKQTLDKHPRLLVLLSSIIILSIIALLQYRLTNLKTQLISQRSGPSVDAPTADPTSIPPYASPTSTPTPSPETQPIDSQFIFLRGKDLWQYSTGELTQITQDKEIHAYSPNTNHTAVAYLTLETVEGLNPDYNTRPLKAYYQNIQETEPLLIHEIEYQQPEPQSDYEITLEDIQFSPNDTEIFITSSTTMWSYNSNTQNLRTIFQNPPKEPGIGGAWSYHINDSNHLNNLTIVDIGHWESKSFQYVNNQTGQQVPLPQVSSYNGQNILGWLDNQEYLVLNYGEANQGTTLIKSDLHENEQVIFESDTVSTVFFSSLLRQKIFIIESIPAEGQYKYSDDSQHTFSLTTYDVNAPKIIKHQIPLTLNSLQPVLITHDQRYLITYSYDNKKHYALDLTTPEIQVTNLTKSIGFTFEI